MLFRDDYAFLQVIGGVVAFLVPIIVILTMSAEASYAKWVILAFTIFGLALGFLSGFIILNGYYKLTDKLKFMKYEDYKNTVEKEPD